MLSIAALVLAGCEMAPDCGTCLGGSVGASCGWCAVNTTTSTRVGAQCADIYSVFDCDVQFQTDKCVQGWKCSTSANNQSQCVPSVGGVADKSACEASCAKPPPKPPTPPKPKPPSPPGFACNYTSLTCSPSPFGDPTQAECEAHCKTQYECDDVAKTCSVAKPGSPGKKYPDNATCAQDCGQHKPVPYQLRGIWRGLAIQNKYTTGEWVANVSDHYIEIWYPDPTGYKLYLKGNTTSVSHSGMYVLSVASTAGKLHGSVSILAGDYSFNPELAGFVQFAIDESNLAQNPTTFDDAMTTPSKTVISFGNCPTGGTPSPPPTPTPTPPGPPTPPPPCKAKIDVVIVLDGSASIVSSDWQLALKFANQIVAGFAGTQGTGIGKDAVEIGVVQFSESAQTVIGLSADQSAITSAVSSLRQMKLNTNTYNGLHLAKQILDTQGRAGAKDKLVILITDGQQNQGAPAKGVSDAMHQEGIQTFGIGVGRNIDEPELQSWCSVPLSKYYFKVQGFSALEQILQKLVADACPHPPAPPAVAAARHLQVAPPPPPTGGKNCKFHLPAGLPNSRRRAEELFAPKPAFGIPAALPQSTDPNSTDPCNAFPSCDKCIGAHAGGKACGWCSGSLKKGGAVSPFQCAGREAIGSQWTCDGHYQTSSCDAEKECGLDGTFRGLRVDNNYDFGEWSAVFASQANSTDVTIEALDMSGKAKKTLKGKMTCDKKCSDGKSLSGVPFTFTTSTGSIMHGICGYTDQAQAETTGLMWAISDDGVATPPTDFDSAMLNTTNSSVYTYYQCASYKKGICAFTAP